MALKKIGWLAAISTLVLILGLGWASAQETADQAASGKAEENWKFHTIVDLDFVMLNVGIPMPENVMIIDSRPKRAKYDKGHIPMAVSIPDSQFDKMAGQLPKDKSTLLIFYCGGPT